MSRAAVRARSSTSRERANMAMSPGLKPCAIQAVSRFREVCSLVVSIGEANDVRDGSVQEAHCVARLRLAIVANQRTRQHRVGVPPNLLRGAVVETQNCAAPAYLDAKLRVARANAIDPLTHVARQEQVFLAAKLEARGDRDAEDPMMSQDLTDIVSLVNGRASLLAEVRDMPPQFREFTRSSPPHPPRRPWQPSSLSREASFRTCSRALAGPALRSHDAEALECLHCRHAFLNCPSHSILTLHLLQS